MKFERLNTNVFLSKRKFYDDKNFPYGFHRSGDFTINESDILSEYGATMLQLAEGKMAPSCPEHERFVKVITGDEQPQYLEETVFIKYINLIREKEKTFPPIKKIQNSDVSIEAEAEEEEDFM